MVMIKSVAAMAVGLGLLAGSALAQQQQGLVNVAVGVEDNVVQVPIGIAAQVCGVDAAVLAKQENTGDVVCTITQDVAAQNNIRGQQGGGQGQGQQKKS